ncbi:uncharacterized protein LOC108942656 [Scleropages formosus]|nr:uncharacterized protein LOC108942656 [Scleropages formosus]
MTAADATHTGFYFVKKLENILDTCKLELTPIDEVWPHLYIGNVMDKGNRLSSGRYETPPVSDLQELLMRGCYSTGPVNQVWPGVYIGNAASARDKDTLRIMGITHIVNAAHGPLHINTGARFYRDLPIDYYGVEADDAYDFDLSLFFYPTAKFIRAALSQYGKVLVHCAMGVSRSAALVLAFLMISEGLTLVEAIKAVRQHRDVCPNYGFLEQLRRLDMTLCQERRQREEASKPKVAPQREGEGELAGWPGYDTPSISNLRHLLWMNRRSTGPVDQVWPDLYIGDESTARDKAVLSNLGITHIVNAADGPHRIRTGASFYRDMSIKYCGVEAADHPDFDLSPFFYPTVEFIQTALCQKGKVLVHCAMGVSRSAALVLAFLMISEGLTLVEAIKAVRQHRDVCPNYGFLEQLRRLDMTLCQEKRRREEAPKPEV